VIVVGTVKIHNFCIQLAMYVPYFYFLYLFSGGSGRTGTYIAISLLLDRLKVEGVVDVFQTVRALRLQRMHMVQSLVRIISASDLVIIYNLFCAQVQYEFCYKTVLEFLDSFELYSNFK